MARVSEQELRDLCMFADTTIGVQKEAWEVRAALDLRDERASRRAFALKVAEKVNERTRFPIPHADLSAIVAEVEKEERA